nr:MAG TPA: N-acetylmuramoyl-L-alanine amidase [Caudoviricetes sp.]
MSNSRLPTYVRLSPNVTKPRRGTIKGVAIHCTAGGKDLPASAFADLPRFVIPDRDNGASCHYVVGGDGSIAQVCGEENRAWCTSNKIDHQLVTIEVASDHVAPYLVNTAAIEALVKLLADICQRNGIPKLLWKGNKSLMGHWDKQNMVVHRWTANKACPGDFLYNLHPKIANAVNEILAGKEEEEMDVNTFLNSLTDEQAYTLLEKAMRHADTMLEPVWSRTDGHWAKATEKGIINGEGPERPMKRDEVVTILGRLNLL